MSASPCVGRSPALLDANCETSPTIPPPELPDAGRPDARPSAPGHSLRIELKFIASQMVYPAIRADVHQFMLHDPHVSTVGADRYVVRTLYFDTPFLDSYHARLDGHAYRTRLRLRRYEMPGMPPSDWFLEIKGKLKDSCLKTGRISLPDTLLQDHLRRYRSLSVQRLFEQNPSVFSAHLPQLWASPLQPTLLVVYEREPFVDPRQSLRVTFDSNIRTVPTTDPYEPVSPTRRILDTVVVEMKFVGGIPLWLHAVIQKFQLARVGLSKYCSGIDARWGAGTGFEGDMPSRPAPAAAGRLPLVGPVELGRRYRAPAGAERAWDGPESAALDA